MGRSKKIFANCHPNQFHEAHGLCHTCYERVRNEDPEIRRRKRLAGRIFAEKHKDKRKLYTKIYRQRFTKDFLRGKDLEYSYGITIDQYKQMALEQLGLCAICHKTPKRGLVVDHSHITEKIRGLLCARCNSILSEYENKEWCKSADKYLEK